MAVTFCRAVRALEPSIPIVVASGGLFGEAGQRTTTELSELNVCQVVLKPHGVGALLRALAESLARSDVPGPGASLG